MRFLIKWCRLPIYPSCRRFIRMAFNRLQSPSRSVHLLNKRLILIEWSLSFYIRPRNKSVLHEGKGVTSSCTIRSFSCLFSKSAEPCSFENSLRRHWTADSAGMIWDMSWKENMCHLTGLLTTLYQVCVILEGLSFFGPPEWVSSVGCFPLTTSLQSLFHQPLNNNVYLKFWKWKKSRFFPQASKCLLWQFVYCPVHLDHRIHVDEVKALDLMRFYRMRTFHLGKSS